MTTNWAVVLIGFGSIAFGLALIRYAPSVSDLQKRQMKALHYPKSAQRRMTPGLARLGGAGFAVMGLIWVIVGGFFADTL
jgi:hypothetical protein